MRDIEDVRPSLFLSRGTTATTSRGPLVYPGSRQLGHDPLACPGQKSHERRTTSTRLNGKVERAHRIDDKEFYRMLAAEVVDDAKLFNTNLTEWERLYNFRPTPLRSRRPDTMPAPTAFDQALGVGEHRQSHKTSGARAGSRTLNLGIKRLRACPVREYRRVSGSAKGPRPYDAAVPTEAQRVSESVCVKVSDRVSNSRR